MKFIVRLLPLLICASQMSAQIRTTPKPPRPERNDDVIVVNTNLVQVDAVVTDKQGRQVSDLRAEDFELFENGRSRTIQSFSYVPLTPTVSNTTDTRTPSNLPPATLRAERPERVRRTIGILIDDFGLSAESISRLRADLERFIEQQTSPDDLIGIVRASGGPGAMQQFTSNRAQLLATVRRLRWYPTGRGRMSSTESLSPIDNNDVGLELQGYSANQPLNLSGKEYFQGSLGALAFVVQGMTRFPGRKSVVLVSENLSLTTQEAQLAGVTSSLEKLLAFANQSSIVISTMDARGLPKAGLTADDNQNNLAANQIHPRIRQRNIRFTVEQDTLSYIARQTGGVFVRYDTDLAHGLRRIMDSEQGYYLLAFRPDDVELGSGPTDRSYKVTLKLKRPELQVRTRSAFHRMVPAAASAPKGKTESLREALISPFVREGVNLKATALYTGGAQVKLLLHVDGRDLDLVQNSDNNYAGSFDLIAVAFDHSGRVANEVGQNQKVTITRDRFEQLQQDGFVHLMTMKLDKPGPYQIRVALRDDRSGRLGSDSQFVEVPDLKSPKLAVVGLIVQALPPADKAAASQGNGDEEESASRGTATRRFEAGDLLTYSHLIYGAEQNKNVGSLVSEVRLFRGDKEIFRSNAQPIRPASGISHEGIVAVGSLRLGKELPPGDYFLQVMINDKSEPVGKRSAEQWIHFQIVK